MSRRLWRHPLLGVLALTLTVASVSAQQQSMRLRGVIAAVDGRVLIVKGRDGSELKVTIAENAAVFAVMRASLADVKPGAFVGIGAMPQPDGTQRAIQVTIFAEPLRGTGEGHRPWDRLPNSTMTNATVAETVKSVDGDVLTVRYRGGEKKIVVPPEATILRYVEGSPSELKPGAHIAIANAVKRPDGLFEAARINVGRDGVVPQ